MSSINLMEIEREKVRKEWKKSESDVLKDIQIIKDWLSTQKHLPETPTANMIEFFLTNCKYSIEKTKQNLDMYYTARDLLPEMYKGIHPVTSENVNMFYDIADCAILPKLTPSLYRVLICKYKDIDPDQADIRKFLSHVINNMYEVRIHEDLALGEVVVIDFEFAKYAVLSKMTPMFLKQLAIISQKVHSNRMKELHILCPPTYIDVIMTVYKSFLSNKLQQRIIVHHSLEELFKYIPKEIMPSDYGGKEKSMKELVDMWKNKFSEYKHRFDKLENMHVNESLRPEKLKNDEILGYHGNFKKIDID